MLARASADARLRPGRPDRQRDGRDGLPARGPRRDARPLPRARRRGRPPGRAARRAPYPDRRATGLTLPVLPTTPARSIIRDGDPDRAMTADDWPDVRRIYAEGIATGDATLEREAPDWHHFDHSHPPDCRFVARAEPGGAVLGWTALAPTRRAGLSRRRLGERLRRRPTRAAAASVGRSSRRSSRRPRRPALDAVRGRPRRERAEPRPPRAGRVPSASASSGGSGQDALGRWRDVVLLERRSAVIGT